MTKVTGDKVERGMLLVNPRNETGYAYKGRFFVPHGSVMKVTKYKIMFDDYTTVPKYDQAGNLIEYEISE